MKEKQDVFLYYKNAHPLQGDGCVTPGMANVKTQNSFYMIPKMNKTKMLTLRMTEAEYVEFKYIMNEAGYKSMSKFIRHKIFRGKERTVRTKLHDENVFTVLRALIMEVNKVGVNYNQLLRKFNAQKPYGLDDYRYKLMHDLQELTKKMLKSLTEVKEGIVGKS